MCCDILIAKLGASISPITGNVLQPYDDIIGHLFGFSYSEIQQLMIYLVVKAAMMQAYHQYGSNVCRQNAGGKLVRWNC